MSHLVDTDWIVDALVGRPAATALLAELWKGGIAISIINYVEVVEGIKRGSDPRRHMLVFRRFLKRVDVHGVSRPVADQAADIRIELRRAKRQVNERSFDILIAATAMTHNLTLVTRNVDDYRDITGLRLYQITSTEP